MPPDPRLHLVTLGRLTLLDESGAEQRDLATRKRKLAMLALLAITQRPWTRDALLDLFWGEQEDTRARHSLSDALSHLRRVLGPDAISHRRADVALGDNVALSVDALMLQEAARRQDWSSVVQLYGGAFLDGVHVDGSPRLEQWIDAERRRLETCFVTASRAECERLLRSGEATACAELAARWLTVAPMSPHAALFRLRALSADGSAESDQRALDEFAALSRRLEREYAARPDQVVVAVADELAARAQQRQAAASPPRAEVSAEPAVTSPGLERTADDTSPSSSSRASAMARRWPLVAVGIAASLVMAALWKRPPQSPAPSSAVPSKPVVLTSSPRARALYEQAVVSYDRDGNREEAIRLLDSAIVLDSTFAMAYRRLGLIYDNGVDARSRSVQMLSLAARFAERLPDDERLMTMGAYHRTVTGNFARAASAYRALLDRSPNDARAWGNLGTVYDYLGDRQRAVTAYERSLSLDAKRATTWMNVADGRYNLGDVAGAWRALDSMALAFPGHPGLFMRTASLAHAENRRDLAESQLRALIASAPDNAYLRSTGEMLLAKAYWSWGRFEEGNAARRRAITLDVERGARDAALVGETDLAMAAVWLRGDSTDARRRLRAALKATPLASLAVDDRPYLDVAIALATVGDADGAARTVAEFERTVDASEQRRLLSRKHHALGAIALARGDLTRATGEFQQVPDPLCAICGLPELAMTYARRGLTDSSRVVVQRYRSTYSQRRIDMTAIQDAALGDAAIR